MKQIEIMGKLVRYTLNSDKLFLGKELKLQILNQIQKGCKEGFLHNKKMMNIGEWETKNLIG